MAGLLARLRLWLSRRPRLIILVYIYILYLDGTDGHSALANPRRRAAKTDCLQRYGRQFPLQGDHCRGRKSAATPAHSQHEKPVARSARFKQLLRVYRLLSNSFHLYLLLRELEPVKALLRAFKPGPLPADCYLVGRFTVALDYDRPILWCLSLGHISWRLLRWRWPSPLPTYAVLLLHQGSARATDAGSRRAEQLSKRLHALTHYPVRRPNARTTYRLRPNRTPAAQRALAQRLALYATANLVMFMSLAALLAPPVLYTILSDRHYGYRYPGCAPQGPANQSGAPASLWHGHKLVSLPADLIANWFIWIDLGVSVLCFAPLVLPVCTDLGLYWKQMHAMLENVLRRTCELEYYLAAEGSLAAGPVGHSPRPGLHARSQPRGPTRAQSHHSGRPLANRVLELQAQMADFFVEFERADPLVSDVLSVVLFAWFATYAVSSYLNVTIARGYNPFMLVLQVSSFTIITLLSFTLLSVHYKSLRSYRLLCSLMARDRSPHKLQFPPLLDFYMHRNKCTWTLFRGQHKFLASSFLAIIGWSVSCSAIVQSLFTARMSGLAHSPATH